MALPSQIHQNKALERISVAFQPMGLVASAFSPMVPVMKETDIYYHYSKDNLRVPETLWADRDIPNQSIWNLSTATYSLSRHALRDLVTDRMRSNADKAVKPDIDTTEGLTHQILLRREIDLFTIINTAANWANITSLSSTQVWTADTTLSNPIVFVNSATTAIRRNSGKIANKIIMSDPAFKAAKEHQSIVDRIKHTSAESVGESLLATLMNLQSVHVSGGVENTGEEGVGDTLTDVATDLALIVYNEPSAGLRKPSAFYTFVKQGNTSAFRVRKNRDQDREGDWIEVSSWYEHKVISSDCAFAINNVT